MDRAHRPNFADQEVSSEDMRGVQDTEPITQQQRRYIDWDLVRNFFAREESLQHAVDQLRRQISHFVRSLQEAEALNQQDKYIIDRLRGEIVQWRACHQASLLEQKTLKEELSKQKGEHIADLTKLQQEMDRCHELESQLEQARKDVSAVEQRPRRIECGYEGVKSEDLFP
ncbi:hypothetical protein AJ80_09493 [Polytolypa hystricis UAMH7299]|uniref:Uncharacterized protein n=1 Tax=Polytolypa hystricis (strain UAMH7299) TaxID=1447883 RepID=A0A2B7WPY8_POLH7|nr:hypothetical protein AJ80_09493 [Polytolypa hystricis UAMH7299]